MTSTYEEPQDSSSPAANSSSSSSTAFDPATSNRAIRAARLFTSSSFSSNPTQPRALSSRRSWQPARMASSSCRGR
ncbi:hypothetical protein PR202_ga12766 [Eleusine coracana subsp. coracana]|uniref:Uncharacterized protein n=1 Tax=Eleusine coracana subsp. coracana TaxID=191504 RepID=A0AAV5CCX8_ELECO|nr:hypothetical protein PR202_ga12766 [Eleusine coracana subsp. coracana]